MSHTHRRKRDHNAHRRGQFRAYVVAAAREREREQAKPRRTVEQGTAPVITDHAIVRWMERVYGLDVRGKIEAEIYAEGRDELIRTVGTGRIRINGTDTCLVVKQGYVVSVLLDKGNAAHG